MTAADGRNAVLEVPARVLVTGVRYASARRLGLSVAALALTLVLGVTYLIFGVFHLDPADRKIHVRVNLGDSGGLLPDRNVTLRGVPVGRVTSVELTDEGVVAVAAIDSSAQIPVGGEVRVAGLSLAGEQYLDFRPTSDGGPFLVDGAEIAVGETSTPVPLSTLMGNLDGMLAQIDPDTVRTIVDELGMSAYLKTSGSRGLHIYVHVTPHTHDATTVRSAAVAFARAMERRRPDLVTASWWKEERGQRVFIDFNQNAPHKTVFGAWCVRARTGAQVSTPFGWDELEGIVPDELTIRVTHVYRRIDEDFLQRVRDA